MAKFCCKHCGMITDNPEIEAFFDLADQHYYKVTCPICLQETRFTRPEPFPTDTPRTKERVIKVSYEEASKWAQDSIVRNVKAQIDEAYRADPTIIHRLLFPLGIYSGLGGGLERAINDERDQVYASEDQRTMAGHIRVDYF